MTGKLFAQAMGKFLAGLILLGVLIFLPAGTLLFRIAYTGYVAGMLLVIMLILRSPELLKKRLQADEKEPEQRQVILLSGLMFLVSFVLAGLNFRFRWIVMPRWTVLAAAAVFLLAYLMYGEVLRENVYLSRTVEVQENQKVIDTGLYGVGRHPMYTATVFLFLAMPLVLGSPLSFLVMLGYLPIIAKRIRNEEAVLKAGLEGYEEYMERVRYRIFPLIW